MTTRRERPDILLIFCLVSLLIHAVLLWQSRSFKVLAPQRPTEMEVTLEPLPREPIAKPKPTPKVMPKPPVPPKPKIQVARRIPPMPKIRMVEHRVRVARNTVRPKPTPPPKPTLELAKATKEKPAPAVPSVPVLPKVPSVPAPAVPVVTPKSQPEDVGVPNLKTPDEVVPTPRIDRIARSADAAPSPIGGGLTKARRNVGGGREGESGAQSELPSDIPLPGASGGGKSGGIHLSVKPQIGSGGGTLFAATSNPLAPPAPTHDGTGSGDAPRLNTNLPSLSALRGKSGGGVGVGVGLSRGNQKPGGGHLATDDQPTVGGTGSGGFGSGSGSGRRGTGGGSGRGAGYGIGVRIGMGSGRGTGGRGAGGTGFGDIGALLHGGAGGGSGGSSGPGGFGTAKKVPFSLKGDIFFLSPGTRSLPDFRRMKPVGSIYATELNIPTRNFDQGFPGVTDRFEWFAIDYHGSFRLVRGGTYQFELTSDDGSKLIIDGRVVIDNDGQHSAQTKKGTVRLTSGDHHIEVQYFQGPRLQIALVLKVAMQAEP